MSELIAINSRELAGVTIQTCNARDLWVFVESKQEFSNWIKDRIEQYGFTQAIDFVVIDNFINDDTAFGGRRKVTDYHIALDMAKEIAMVERNAKGKEVRQYFIDCELQATAAAAAKPKTRLELAREQVALLEHIEHLEQERNHAIATKAEIGSRREATSMNTASQAVKLVNKLSVELDRSKAYCTIKRMQMIHHGQKFNWRLLKSAGIEMGMEPIDVFDANYGTVKAYHVDVWREAYAIGLDDAGMQEVYSGEA
ncbi:antA/AntB antirepressor family protein [Methylomonas fluvii]|uniref:AntA/AntB antirepressor family protein n=1 Tax=Methylomonas fluvii TaxID=1854564 RepID=A0ABR9DE08_9GAMM|nr:antA/AntB antirepressor family protein [Methylomonas fluvii]MBD9361334.1 antA/AntB antirepressor family protein [Methylomonas fluvii]